jgi:hypothetical protein
MQVSDESGRGSASGYRRATLSGRLYERGLGRSRLIRVGHGPRAVVTGLEADARSGEAVGSVADRSAVVDQRREALGFR